MSNENGVEQVAFESPISYECLVRYRVAESEWNDFLTMKQKERVLRYILGWDEEGGKISAALLYRLKAKQTFENLELGLQHMLTLCLVYTDDDNFFTFDKSVIDDKGPL